MAYKVIIAEDIEPIRRLLHESLAKAGFDVRSAASVPEARELDEQDRADIIVTDNDTPLANQGRDWLRELKVKGRLGILVSGMSVDEARDLEFIPKPLSVRQLVSRIKTLLERNENA